MSYCKNIGNSDVYMYQHVYGKIYCSNCSLTFYKRTEAIDHLKAHRILGERVPDYAIKRLEDEIKELGNDV